MGPICILMQMGEIYSFTKQPSHKTNTHVHDYVYAHCGWLCFLLFAFVWPVKDRHVLHFGYK